MKRIINPRLLAMLLAPLATIVVVFGVLSWGVARADGLSQGYLTSDNQLKPGMVAALKATATASTTPSVERGSLDNLDKIIGIATDPSQNLVVISPGDQQVYVQTSGDVMAYVSDLNGGVKKGDLLTVSPLKGVLMKADSGSTIILGIALDDFSSVGSQSYTVQTSGASKQTNVAEININLDHKANGSYYQPSTLANLGKSVTGRDVSEVRVLIVLIIFIMILIAEATIIYGAVSSAISAVGRNPLASGLIRGELIRVLFIAIFVLTIGIGAIYAVLYG